MAGSYNFFVCWYCCGKDLEFCIEKPLIAVDHMKGHIYANFIERDLAFAKIFSCLALIVSGGHTELVLMKDIEKFEKIGQTLDDAAGEAFDKIAKMLDLDIRVEPVVSRYAENDAAKYLFPRPLLKHKNFDFSFAGLKTSVLYFARL